MGRSLRSQTKKRFRAIKRENVFKPVEDARLERLAAAQAKDAEKPKVGDFMDDVAPTVSKEENVDKMDVGEGGGMSNRQAKKLKMAKKAKRQKTKAKKKINTKSTTF